MSRILTCSLVVGFAIAWSAAAHGQGSSAFRNGFGSSSSGMGGFGSSGFGGGGGFGSGMGGGGFGSGGFGSGMGSGGFGSGGFGSSGTGSFSAGNLFGGQNTAGGYGASGGQAFVGRDAGDMNSSMNQMNRAGAQFFNQMNRNMSRDNRNRDSQQVQNAPQTIRVDLKVAFNAPRIEASTLITTLRSRLARLMTEHSIGQPVVTMEGDTVVLSGVAADEFQRSVVERLISLEPGVRAVTNRMTIADAAPASAVSPASN